MTSPTNLVTGDAATQAAAPMGFAATVAAGAGAPATFVPPTQSRITVLPRIEDGEGAAVRLEADARTRYEPVKLLGAGGMGEVVLVQDQDIARRVAIKRLLPEMTHPSLLARFVDEIRTVGRLEHPNIVPIHDVGVDELGRYYFVMKYVEGETLESIVEKLSAGDPAYHARYSYERRIEIFLGLLHALEYAHANGVVHRDIKPANVMVGRYGEVVLMDWGIAKPLAAKRDPAATAEATLSAGDGTPKSRMFATQLGAILGTPAYMAPEQARGENDRLDARCDLYSAAVLFHELIGLRHYLHDADSMESLLRRVGGSEDPTFFQLLLGHHPEHGSAPAELVHFVHKGMSKDRALRFQSAGEMIAALERILEGKVQIQCHITFTKRVARELGRFVDARPWIAFFMMLGTVALLILGIWSGISGVLHAARV
jgi:eukaryotic-like serine/threonine-protein kinase